MLIESHGLESFQVDDVIERALAEDLASGDRTTEALIPADLTGRVVIIPKSDGILAGVKIAISVWSRLNPDINVISALRDGSLLHPADSLSHNNGSIIAEIEGEVSTLLKGERTAINILQHMSGIATETRRFVDAVKGYDVRIVDTRKTGPGLRSIQKYAVRVGGGSNHRQNLGDGVLIKDNHLAALSNEGIGLAEIVRRARSNTPHPLKIEVEVETIDQVSEALSANADILLLDNMPIATMQKAVTLIDGRAITEASGNVSLENVREIAASGVDMISIGRLTHSVKALDISLDLIK